MKYYRKFCKVVLSLLWLTMVVYCLYEIFTNQNARMVIGIFSIFAIVLHIILTGVDEMIRD